MLEGSMLSSGALENTLRKIENLPMAENLTIIEEDDEVQMMSDNTATMQDG